MYCRLPAEKLNNVFWDRTCRNITSMLKIFHEFPTSHWKHQPRPDVVTCTSMIASCSRHQKWIDAIKIFEGMSQSGILPNLQTYNSILHVFGQSVPRQTLLLFFLSGSKNSKSIQLVLNALSLVIFITSGSMAKSFGSF